MSTEKQGGNQRNVQIIVCYDGEINDKVYDNWIHYGYSHNYLNGQNQKV